jgi:hypothetical protein
LVADQARTLHRDGASEQELRAELAARLRRRKDEIELGVVARLDSVSGEELPADTEYLEGLRNAVTTAVDYGIGSVELGAENLRPVPPLLVAQARIAACSGIELDMVLRRYFAGFVFFAACVLEEAESIVRERGGRLHRLLQVQTAQFDQLISAISDEYSRERERWARSPDRRRAEKVERLLSGELVDPASVPIELEGWHVGIVARGPQVAKALKDAAARLDLRLFHTKSSSGTLWAWLSAQRVFAIEEVQSELAGRDPGVSSIALGEVAGGLAGWRLTHRQARACLPVAIRGPEPVVNYAHVGLVATLLRDEVLIGSLRQNYLHPLSGGREDSEVLRETLRAYLATDRNVSSTAAALGLSRSTVSNRLRAIERRLGQPLGDCAMELEAALKIDELSGVGTSAEYAPVRRSN